RDAFRTSTRPHHTRVRRARISAASRRTSRLARDARARRVERNGARHASRQRDRCAHGAHPPKARWRVADQVDPYRARGRLHPARGGDGMKRFRLTIRLRLTLWYAAALLAVLMVYAGVVFAFLEHNLWQQLDRRLHEEVEDMDALIHASS